MTTSTVVARAPGKLFLSGEWAVLQGAPAVVVAVDRFATVEMELADGPGPLVVHALAEGSECQVERAEAGELPGGDAGAVLAAWRAVGCRAPGLGARHARVVVDARPFLVGGEKLGLGRSAATLSAAVAALLAASGRGVHDEVLETAVAAHRDLQGGQGSGADVAAAVLGGVLEVRRAGARLAAVPRRLPAPLHLLVGYTGAGAATDPLLRRFAAAADAPAALAALAGAAERAAAAVASGDAAALCAAVDASGELLARLGRELDLPLVTPALARLVAAAHRLGVAAKPSGAGGGDCGIALAPSAAAAEAVREAWRADGILPLPVSIHAGGVEVAAGADTAREVSLG